LKVRLVDAPIAAGYIGSVAIRHRMITAIQHRGSTVYLVRV